MLRTATLCLALLCATTMVLSQTPANPVTLNANELLVLRTFDPVTSATAKVGDPVRFELIRPVKAGMLTAIPSGAVATGKVALVEKKRAKGHGGKLGITIDEIHAATGEIIKLRAYDEKQAGNNRSNDIGSLIMAGPLPGVGAMLIPIALLVRGNDMVIEKGTRFAAVTDSATTFDFDALAKVQPAPRTPSSDFAELYIYRLADNHPEDIDTWPIAIGEEFVGYIRPGRFIHLRVPPGTYWLHHSSGNNSGEIRIDKEKPERLFELHAEGGHTYYVRQNLERVVSFTKGPITHFELVNESTAPDDVAGLFAPGWRTIDPDAPLKPNNVYGDYGRGFHMKCYITRNEDLARMQAQPGPEERKKRKSAVVPKQEIDCKQTKLNQN